MASKIIALRTLLRVQLGSAATNVAVWEGCAASAALTLLVYACPSARRRHVWKAPRAFQLTQSQYCYPHDEILLNLGTGTDIAPI